MRIREHVYPRDRRHMPVRSRDHVLATVGSETAEAVVEEQIGPRRRGAGRTCEQWDRLGAMRPGRLETREIQVRRAHFNQAAIVDLIEQRSPPVADDGARNRLEKRTI